jgi:type I restriction enzyme R subunit
MTVHRKIHFEDEICADLGAAGWLPAERDAGCQDRARTLLPGDLMAWVLPSPPAGWAALTKNHATRAAGKAGRS